jgi:hypothetical protein
MQRENARTDRKEARDKAALDLKLSPQRFGFVFGHYVLNDQLGQLDDQFSKLSVLFAHGLQFFGGRFWEGIFVGLSERHGPSCISWPLSTLMHLGSTMYAWPIGSAGEGAANNRGSLPRVAIFESGHCGG